jgi:hypothetical protein
VSPRTTANSRITGLAGVVLFVLLAALGITILRIHQLRGAHIAIGLVLLGPLVVKVGSTGWRFLRYYTGDADYVGNGAPRPLLRVLAPVVVVTTLAVFASGIGLLFTQRFAVVHKVSFVLWFAVTTVHVLAYIGPAVEWTLADVLGRGAPEVLAGRRLRLLIVGASLLVGAALAIAVR